LKGSFSALEKICEDAGRDLDPQLQAALVPKFIQHADSPHDKIRIHALTCANIFIANQSPAMFSHLEQYTLALSRRATDQVGAVRRLVCQAFVHLLDVRPDILLPQLPHIVPFLVFAMQDTEEEVALEACEFWLAFAERDEIQEHLRPYLATYETVDGVCFFSIPLYIGSSQCS
jgi:transportin-1